MESSTRYARSPDGVSIAYQVHGEGPLDLVFVPGFVSHVELVWEEPAIARLLRRLASFSRLIVFDKRGQGLSDRLGRPPTLEESMDDLGAVLDAAGSERAALFGVSEGGPMSALFAATNPGRVSALVLYGTYARMLKAPDFPEGIREEQLDAWAERMREQWGGPVAVELWAPSYVGNPEFERWWARLLRQGTSPSGAIDLMNLYREIDVRAALPAIAGSDACPASPRRPARSDPPGSLPGRPDSRRPLRRADRGRPPADRRRPGGAARRDRGVPGRQPRRPRGRSRRWRRSSSPTSSARPRSRPSSATVAGAICSSATTPPSAASSRSTGATR